MEEADELKKLRYAELVAEAEDQGWKVEEWPVEVGCRGFVAGSTSRFLRQVDVQEASLQEGSQSHCQLCRKEQSLAVAEKKRSRWCSQVTS